MIPLERLHAMVRTWRDKGLAVVQVNETLVVLNVAGKCQEPQTREMFSRPSPNHRDPVRAFKAAAKALWPGATVVAGLDQRPVECRTIRVHAGPRVAVHQRTKVPLTVRMIVRCRQCDSCRRLREYMWSERAKFETKVAPRTWFGTLTLSPEAHVTMVSRARVRLLAQGIDFETLPAGEQFAERHKMIGVEITKMLKRIRKNSGASFRYLLVAEHHQSGLPHYHMLLHEQEVPVRHAVLSSEWKLGFEQWRLVAEETQATYLCKYLSKNTRARVRASAGYGDAALHAGRCLERVVTFGRNPGFPEIDPEHPPGDAKQRQGQLATSNVAPDTGSQNQGGATLIINKDAGASAPVLE